jgi:small subunit ribosomal protein S20
MANTKQAAKRAEQSTLRNQLRSAQRSRVRTAIKAVRKAVATGDKAAAGAALKSASSVLDSAAGKNVVHKNNASRNKSRLAAAVKAMG